ncbi:MAG: glycosyl transferase family 2 [Cypionkella sp.]|uniref:glycosyltransferase family 2 protein n=1 Tax=Cypionkella sp. TaxID=2811411 RepID=UPI002635FF84|nr:glycosyltransferase family 2 protein [Cypionkella sp.]MDB5659517.1 glycosyl transferase family 2 [Cypionkella sp.]
MAEVQVLRRSLGVRDCDLAGVPRLLDCVETADERRRYFFGAGSQAAAFLAQATVGCAVIEAIAEVAGAVMITAHGVGPLALADAEVGIGDGAAAEGSATSGFAGGTFDATPSRAEPDLFSGRNCLLSSRIDETAAQVAEGLVYHARKFGANGAVIINRAQNTDPGFDDELAKALNGLDFTVVLLDSPLPLGRPNDIAQNHLYQAPAAPGKARMQKPEPDRWRAALGEPLIYEVAKWRFLSEARAVLALDVSDIVARDAVNPFDLCTTTEGGCIALSGMLTYPWRVKGNKGAGFGDHICRQFDAIRGVTRWGVAPRKAGLPRAWRMIRIADAHMATLPMVPFYRAMAIRVSGESTAKLVPKTSLIEDARLLAIATEAFQHNPVRVPVTELKSVAEKSPQNLRTMIVTTMKNEGPFLLEWIAYHRAIGVSDFLVYTNDCTDGTDTFLQLLQAKGICEHRANPWKAGDVTNPQYSALQASESEPIMQNADWSICMDCDEFINIKLGDGTLQTLYAAMGEANMISMTWRLFGDSGVVDYEDKPIIAQFDRCAPEIIRKPHQAWGFKTLFRNNDIFRKFGVHRPKGLQPEHWDQIKWLNGSGRPMPQSVLRNGWRSTLATYGYDWVQLNHYAVRSVESFLVKRDRGRVNHVDRDQGSNYWFRMSHNQDRDTSIQNRLPMFQAEMDRLLADPDIRAAHQHSVGKHREKIGGLLTQDAQKAFYAELTSERMRRLCQMQNVFGSAVFALGPDVIPDAVALDRNLPADFFFTVEHEGEASH